MANSRLRALLIAALLVPAACGRHQGNAPKGSITIELPPARPATARPGFTIEATNKVISPRDDRSSAAVHRLVETL